MRFERKVRLDQLAAFGGQRLFAEPLHVGCPNLGDTARFQKRLEDVFARRRLTNGGPMVEAFEARCAELSGTRHAIAVVNATAGLELLLRDVALRRGPGEVVMPSCTFIATAHAVRNAGLEPRFVDVTPSGHHVDPEAIATALGPSTRAILGVHLWGGACDTAALEHLARRHELPLIFDGAHAFAVEVEGRPVATTGTATVFSFHATKLVNAFEGGLIATNDDALAARLGLMRNFGFAEYDSVVAMGTNAKMHEASAAMGLTSLESLADFVAAGERNATSYALALADISGVHLREPEGVTRSNHHYVVAEVYERDFGMPRDALLWILQSEGVLARRYFWPGCHRHEPYRSDPRHHGIHLPRTEAVLDRVLCLPSGSAVSEAQVRDVCDLVRFVSRYAAEISERWSASPRG
jgi:dTDP-4-amino-4,6-dideoxygalactose transaminase